MGVDVSKRDHRRVSSRASVFVALHTGRDLVLQAPAFLLKVEEFQFGMESGIHVDVSQVGIIHRIRGSERIDRVIARWIR